MMETIDLFISEIYSAPSLVWTMAVLMSVISGYMLHTYTDDYLFAVFSGLALFVAILIAHVAFIEMGVFFTTDKESNIAASAGAAVCSVTAIVVLMLRLWHAAHAFRTSLREEG